MHAFQDFEDSPYLGGVSVSATIKQEMLNDPLLLSPGLLVTSSTSGDGSGSTLPLLAGNDIGASIAVEGQDRTDSQHDGLLGQVLDTISQDESWLSMNGEKTTRSNSENGEIAILFATTLVEDALHGRKHGVKLGSIEQLHLYRFFHTSLWRNFTFMFSWFLLLLTAVEDPSTSSSSSTLPGSGVWSLGVTVVCEGICVAILWADAIVHYRWLGRKNFLNHGWALTKAVVLFLITVDLCVMASPVIGVPRFSRPVRPWLLIARMRNVRNSFSAAVRTIPAIIPTLLLLVFLITQSSLLGWLIFNPSEPIWENIPYNATPSGFCSLYSKSCDAYFATLSGSIWQVLLLLPGISFPEVALPYWEASHWSMLFFCINLLIGYWFLMRLLLVVSFQRYHEECMKTIDTRRMRERIALNGAYKILCGNESGVRMEKWKKVMRILRCDSIVSDAAFAAADEKGDEVLQSSAAFRHAVTLLEIDVQKLGIQSCSTHRYNCVEQWWFRLFFDILAVISVARLVVVRAVPSLHGKATQCFGDDYSASGCILGLMAWALLIFFAAEIILKVVSMGPKMFMKDGLSVVDAFVTICALVGAFSSMYSNVFIIVGDFRALRVLRALRLLRLLRLTAASRGFLWALGSVGPVLMRFLVIFSTLGYFFAVVGMELFHDKLSQSSASVKASSYGKQDLFSLNFDNFGNALTTVFVMLQVRKFPAIMEGCIAGTSNAVVAVLFFVGFYIIAVVFLSNILVAFLLQSYTVVANEDSVGHSSSKLERLIRALAERLGITVAEVKRAYVIEKKARFASTHKKLHHARELSGGAGAGEEKERKPSFEPLFSSPSITSAATTSDVEKLRSLLERIGIRPAHLMLKN